MYAYVPIAITEEVMNLRVSDQREEEKKWCKYDVLIYEIPKKLS